MPTALDEISKKIDSNDLKERVARITRNWTSIIETLVLNYRKNVEMEIKDTLTDYSLQLQFSEDNTKKLFDEKVDEFINSEPIKNKIAKKQTLDNKEMDQEFNKIYEDLKSSLSEKYKSNSESDNLVQELIKKTITDKLLMGGTHELNAIYTIYQIIQALGDSYRIGLAPNEFSDDSSIEGGDAAKKIAIQGQRDDILQKLSSIKTLNDMKCSTNSYRMISNNALIFTILS